MSQPSKQPTATQNKSQWRQKGHQRRKDHATPVVPSEHLSVKYSCFHNTKQRQYNRPREGSSAPNKRKVARQHRCSVYERRCPPGLDGGKEAQEIQGKTGVVISARTDAQKYFAEANSQYNLAAYTNHADEAYPLPVCTKAAELYDLEATELQKAYNGEESLSDVCKSLTKQADKLLQE